MIEFRNVTKTYPGCEKPVYQDFSVRIEKGELILLTGSSGSGKSTFIRLLLMEARDYDGEIFVMEKSLSKIKAKEIPYYRRKIGVVFQDAFLIEERSVYENIELARSVVGANPRENHRIITSLLTLLGLTNLYKRMPGELSGGERQRVCLARALVNFPTILLADEPTGNLSPQETKEIMKLFELIHQQGVTIVIATHDRTLVTQLPGREIVLTDEGEQTLE